MEASHIVYLLQPHFSNARKRLVKSPKLYFLDTGLACSLIGIDSPDELFGSEFYGALFEAAVVGEVLKTLYARGETPHLTFWRDSNKREIDILVEKGLRAVKAIEIKPSATFRPTYFDILASVATTGPSLPPEACSVVYGGDETMGAARGRLVSWRETSSLV